MNFEMSYVTGKWNYCAKSEILNDLPVSQSNGTMNLYLPQKKNRGAIISASDGQKSSVDTGRKRFSFSSLNCLLYFT